MKATIISAIKIRLSKNAEVSVSDQLTTQIKIGIASGDLSDASMIICDSLTAESLPPDERIKIFPLISDVSRDDLRA